MDVTSRGFISYMLGGGGVATPKNWLLPPKNFPKKQGFSKFRGALRAPPPNPPPCLLPPPPNRHLSHQRKT